LTQIGTIGPSELALRHPDIYPTFLDLSGEREPALSIDRRVTVGQSFGVGNVEKFDAQTPLRMLANNRYPTSFGFFAAGALDSTYMANMSDVSTAASKSGMKVQTFLVPDKVHSWRVGLLGLAAGIEATSARLGLSR
jgi:hypothetical protein